MISQSEEGRWNDIIIIINDSQPVETEGKVYSLYRDFHYLPYWLIPFTSQMLLQPWVNKKYTHFFFFKWQMLPAGEAQACRKRLQTVTVSVEPKMYVLVMVLF